MGAKPKIVFRADAGSNIGFGHLVRSVALASYLRDEFECSVVSCNDVPEGAGFIGDLIAEAGATQVIPDKFSVEKSGDFNEWFLNSLRKDQITVLDNYYHDISYQRLVRKMSRASVTIHDIPGAHIAADLFLSPSPVSQNDFYFDTKCPFYAGIEWSFLREPFLHNAKKRNRKTVERIVIGMGGADPLGLTDRILRILGKILPDSEIDVIAGPSAKINTPVSDSIHIHPNVSAIQIRDLLDNADLGIFSSSTACIEANARKLPVAAGWYAGNQLKLYEHGVEKGLFSPLGDLRDNEVAIEKKLINIIKNYNPLNIVEIDFQSRKEDIINIFKKLWKDSASRV